MKPCKKYVNLKGCIGRIININVIKTAHRRSNFLKNSGSGKFCMKFSKKSGQCCKKLGARQTKISKNMHKNCCNMVILGFLISRVPLVCMCTQIFPLLRKRKTCDIFIWLLLKQVSKKCFKM